MSSALDFGPTEYQVLDIISGLPRDSFIRNYVEAVVPTSDTHVAHHLMGALMCLTQAIPIEIYFPFGRSPIYGNLFGLCAGSSGSRKTVAVKTARMTLKHAKLGGSFTAPSSREALIDALQDDPRRLITYGEFGDFLASSAEGSYLASLRTTYNDASDCEPLMRERVRRRTRDGGEEGGATGCPNPRLSVLGAVAPTFFDIHAKPSDWTGGFFPRFLTFSMERERLITVPEEDETDEPLEVIMGATLRRLADGWTARLMEPLPRCGGFTPEARAYYDQWAAKIDKPVNNHGAIAAATNRFGTLAIKLALLMEWEASAPRLNFDGSVQDRPIRHASGVKWRVSLNMIKIGCRIVEELHAPSVAEIVGGLAGTAEERLVRGVLKSLTHADRDGRGMVMGDLSEETRASTRKLKEALETLLLRNQIKQAQRRDTTAMEFRLVGGTADTVIDLEAARATRLFGEG